MQYNQVFKIILYLTQGLNRPLGKLIFQVNIILGFLRIFLICVLFFIPYSLTFAAKKIHFELKLYDQTELASKLQNAITDVENSANLDVSVKQLDYWEKETEQILYRILKSYGYYGATIESTKLENDSEKILTFAITLGNRYTVQKVNINFAAGSNQTIKAIEIDKLATKQGSQLDTYKIQEDQKKIASFLEKNYCLLGASISHQALIDYINETFIINFIIDAQNEAAIKDVSFEGLKTLNESYVKKLVTLQPGQCFRRSQIINAVGNLHASGLFLSATPIIPNTTDENGQIPIIFQVKERKMRNIKLGLNYSTDKDLRITGSLEWKHQNLFGNGENLALRLNGNKAKKESEFDYQKPFFLRDDQSFIIKGKYNYEYIKAYNAKIGSISASVNRKINPVWNAGIGTKFAHSSEQSFANNEPHNTFLLSSLPTYIEYDKRNNIMNSTKGVFVRLDFAPFSSKKHTRTYDSNTNTKGPLVKSHFNFSKVILQGNAYHSFNKNLILAFKGRGGSILANTERSNDISVTEKFFLGGNNSVRGYQYNTIGQLDENKKVMGGLSFIEMSAELRIKMKNNFGIVSFLDAGNSRLSKTPQFKNILYGAGFGIRYYTNFAPLRLDVAFPINKRKGVDKKVQVYFGIGQSF